MPDTELATDYKAVTRHIMPLLFAAYVVAYVDRICIGLAKLRMMDDLGLSDGVYGFGAGIFFVGFVLFEVPSNLLLERIGARIWLARIMIVWGLLTMATLFVASAGTFYLIRLLLGAAEAGFVPGVIYYLSNWYPPRRRGRIFATLLLGAPVGGIVAGPLSGWIMTALDGTAGRHGWQWMFLLEGLPAVALGLLALRRLDERPRDAAWLTSAQAARIEDALARSRARSDDGAARRVPPLSYWALTFVMFSISITIYAGVFWIPSFIRACGIHDLTAIGALSALPYLGAGLMMVGVGHSSDRLQDRIWHIAGVCALSAAGFAFSCLPGLSAPSRLAGFVLSTATAIGLTPVIWAHASALLHEGNKAVFLALLNVIGAVGGFLGPTLMGLLNASGAAHAARALPVAGLILLAGAAVLAIGLADRRRLTGAPPAARPRPR